jgi:hypothetical protein
MKELKILIGLLILTLGSCSETANSNKLDSDNYNTKDERIEILKKEIKSFSEIENAEFELFNVNGFSNSRTTVPGASSWDYKFAIRINPLDVDKWTNGMISIDSVDYNDSWMEMIIKVRAEDWRTESEPEIYTRKGDNVMMFVYRNEGILFKSVVNL